MQFPRILMAGILLCTSVLLNAQSKTTRKPAYTRDSIGSFILGVNPAHLFFGHATIYTEFMHDRGRKSFRTALSFGIDDDRERYNWAAGFHFKMFQPGHFYKSSSYLGLGILGGSISTGFDDAFLVEPQFIGGWHFAPGKVFNLSLEAGVGISIPTSSKVVVEQPLGVLLGLIIGFRV